MVTSIFFRWPDTECIWPERENLSRPHVAMVPLSQLTMASSHSRRPSSPRRSPSVAVLVQADGQGPSGRRAGRPDGKRRATAERGMRTPIVAEAAASHRRLSVACASVMPVAAMTSVDFRDELTAPQLETAVTRLHERVTEAVTGLTSARLIAVEPARRESDAAPRAPGVAA
jgi:hypothetical protein